MEELKLLLAKHAHRLLSKTNVVGVGLGYKTTGGRQTGTKAIVVLVSRKMPVSRLSRADRVPKTLAEAKTDVIEVGELRLLPALGQDKAPALEEENRTKRLRPAQPGISVGHYQITAGTFGALVYDQESHTPMILSNNHVLANITDGRDGRAKEGDPVYQPGRYDGGAANDTIAHLERFVPIQRVSADETCPIARGVERAGNCFLKLAFPGHRMRLSRQSNTENLVDAAVATLTNPEDAIADIMGLGPVTGVVEPEPGMKVVKSGRTSGISTGEIRVIGASVRVGLGEVGFAVFSDQIITTAMAQPGDSGSLVVLEDGHQAVGLLSAGSSQATVLSRIGNVLKLLNVSFS